MRSFSLILLAAAKVSVASPVNSEFQQYAKIADPSATSYEYIVVGSGAGGGPLAARLAMAGKRTLLIEAGDDQGENFRQAVPVLHAQSTEDPTMAWDFWVQHYQNPERQALDSKMTWDTPDGRTYVGLSPPRGSKMRGILYPRAATLGGCTAHNALVTVYPHDRDWELIENLTGDTTWSPKNMRRIFEKMEKNEYITGLTASRAGHGFTGWFHTNIFDLQQVGISGRLFDTKLLQILYGVARTTSKGGIFSSIADLASLLTADLNRETRTRDTDVGMWPIPIATAKGKRAGSRDFVLETYNAKTLTGTKRYPLDIALNTFVTKVTFANTTAGGKPKVTGVEYLQGKYLYKAAPNAKSTAKGTSGKFTAEKEVIISGGAYNSPQILKLSGIGPKAELQRHNIPVLVDLPGVGANLQDHMEIGVEHESATPFKITADCTWGKAGDPCMADWRLNRGIYPATNGFPVAVIKKSSVATRDRWFGANPDLFLFGGPTSFHGYYPGYSNDAYNSGNWSWVVLKAHTANGAGTVTLRSADPLDPPNIQFNFFDSGDAAAARNDVQAMVEGIELGRELTEASNDRELREKLPGRAAKTTAQLSDYVKAESWSHHASCTCPIGADNDALSVLDSKFRVRGTSGLRVVDASVFPRIPGFFVAVPTYMVGEKAAESILTGN